MSKCVTVVGSQSSHHGKRDTETLNGGGLERTLWRRTGIGGIGVNSRFLKYVYFKV